MYVRIITFQLDGISPLQYEEHCREIAGDFLEWPGLIAKVWLSDVRTNTYGGVYLFESKQAADRSRATDIFVGMQQTPSFTDVTIREFETVGPATAVTARSLLAVRVSH